MTFPKKRFAIQLLAAFVLVVPGFALAQTLSDADLVKTLQEGGLVIVMRHASSPGEEPDSATANPDNVNRERQLDESGRRSAIAMGVSLRRLAIPITEVDSSPTYRTLETARLAGFAEVQIRDYLGNQGMQESSEANAARLLANVANVPSRGNRLLVTHSPNVAAAFPLLIPTVEEGEALVFDLGVSSSVPIARIKIAAWPALLNRQ